MRDWNDVFKMLCDAEIIIGAQHVRLGCRKYMMKKTDAGVLPTVRKKIPLRWRKQAYVDQDGRCNNRKCREGITMQNAEADHIIPLSRGGLHERRNIQLLCRKCNRSKGSDDPIRRSKKTHQLVTDQLL